MKKIIIPVRNPSSGQDLLLWCKRPDNQSDWQWTRYQLPTRLDLKPLPALELKPLPALDLKPLTGLDLKPLTGLDLKPLTGLDLKPLTGLHLDPPTKPPKHLKCTQFKGSDILSLAAHIRSLLQAENNTLNGVNLDAYFCNQTSAQCNWADPLIPREAYIIALLLVAGGLLVSFSLLGYVGGSAHALMAGAALLFVLGGGMLGMSGIGYFLAPSHTSRAVLFQSSPSDSKESVPSSRPHSE